MSSSAETAFIPSETPTTAAPSEAEVVNPKYWHELADIYVLRARQDHQDLSGLLVDIDATKAVNDELGHDVGNELIDMVDELTALIPHQVRSDAAKGGGRPVDVVMSHPSDPPELEIPGLVLPEPQTARIGGDEFGILLPRTGEAGAMVVRDRLFDAVNEQLLTPRYQRLRELGVGVSIGVATLDASMKTAADFLRAMDRSMYDNKIDQAPELSDEQQREFISAMEHLVNSGVRLRDAPKYLKKYGLTALLKAFEDQERDSAEGTGGDS